MKKRSISRKIKWLITSMLIAFVLPLFSQQSDNNTPMIGAQVFIEPGQTEAETEQWFSMLKEHGMTICRIRMFESYMHMKDGSWDFSLFDRAFRLAEKYDIKVLGTFFPATDKTDIGGWKFPDDNKQLESFAEYIQQLVNHFRQYKSLYGWVLINEPGGRLKDNEFSRQMRLQWNKDNPQSDFLENGFPVLVDLQEGRFRRYMTSWMLNWIAGEVRKYDTTIHLHVNNHAIFSNLPEYDFPYWRTFLNSLGGSAHASWHFDQFKRSEYALAMSVNSEILSSGAGHLPWLMTELQGGNNTYSGINAMCPTPEEISQWLWIVLGTGGKGAIFWTLNSRASGIESGEWALLDFQHQPTGRMEAIKGVTRCLNEHKALFEKAQKIETGISLVYFKESIWTENVLIQGTSAAKDGRKTGLSDLVGYFQAFSEMGINPDIQAFEEYDFSQSDYTGKTMVLANQIAIPAIYKEKLENFVSKGGLLIVDGLTGFYDENVHNVMLTGFPFKKLFGGEIAEFRYIDSIQNYPLDENIKLPVALWKGIIKPDTSSSVLYQQNTEKLITIHRFGKGNVIWIPTLAGYAARRQNGQELASWLKGFIPTAQFMFSNYEKGLLMKTLRTSNGYITVLMNKTDRMKEVGVLMNGKKMTSELLYNNKGGSVAGNKMKLYPEETLVINWKELE